MNNDPNSRETSRERNPDPSLFERWVNAPFWYPDEGVVLAFGLNPKLAIRTDSNGRDDIIAGDTFQRFRQLAASAVKTGALAERSLPLDFLDWADAVGLKFHGVWREALEILAARNSNRSGPERSSLGDRRATLIHDWVDAPSWTLDEGTALSLSIEPRRIQSGTLPRDHPQEHEFDRRRQFASRAREQLAIDWHPKPRDFIAWAETVDIRFHPDWHAALPSEPSPTKPTPTCDESEKPLGTRERTTLLKLVIGMAVNGCSFDSNKARNLARGDIVNDLALLGVPLDHDTVLKYLRECAELLPRDAKDE